MRKLKQLCITTVLSLALSYTAFAGSMDTPGITNPPPPNPISTTGGMDTPGVTASGTSSSEAMAMDSVTDIALFLFDSMMTSIF